MRNTLLLATVLLAGTALAGTAQANLLVNGGFEASSSSTSTPTGWLNIGHTEGVITYAAFGTPAYDGLNYYDIGGFGSPLPAVGDGIQQTVATDIGTTYTLTFGYSSENGNGGGDLDITIGGDVTHIVIPAPDGSGPFQRPFTTASINYTALGASTTIAFTVTGSGLGSNDPLIDGVSFAASQSTSTPEPASLAVLGIALAGLGAARRRRA